MNNFIERYWTLIFINSQKIGEENMDRIIMHYDMDCSFISFIKLIKNYVYGVENIIL